MKTHQSVSKIVGNIFIVLFGLVVVIAFRPNFAKLLELQTHHSPLKQKLLLEEKKNAYLKKESNGLSTDPEFIEKVAREKLGWSRPAETVYRFQTNSPNNRSSDSKKSTK